MTKINGYDWDKCTDMEGLKHEIRRLQLIEAEYQGYLNGVKVKENDAERSVYETIFGRNTGMRAK